MATVRKTNPVGIDAVIDNLQLSIHKLVDSGKWSSMTVYPRAYKNESEAGIKPEIFTGTSGVDYEEVLYNDKLAASCFFITDDNMNVINENQRGRGRISVILQVDLNQIKPNITHRPDEEARYDAVIALSRNRYNWNVTNVITGIANVYREFDRRKIKYTDMNKRHVFRVEMEGTYSYDCKINTTGV